MSNWKIYKNGNYIVKFNLDDGTKIRETEDDEFIPDHAENMDVKICNYCDIGCPCVTREVQQRANLETF